MWQINRPIYAAIIKNISGKTVVVAEEILESGQQKNVNFNKPEQLRSAWNRRNTTLQFVSNPDGSILTPPTTAELNGDFTLDVLDDVTTSGVTDGQSLVYNSATNDWEPGDSSGSSSSSTFYKVATYDNSKYTVSIPSVSDYIDGLAVRIKVPNGGSHSGTIAVQVNDLDPKDVLQSSGDAAQNWNENSIYTVVYNGSNFILQGEGGVIPANTRVLKQILNLRQPTTEIELKGINGVFPSLTEICVMPFRRIDDDDTEITDSGNAVPYIIATFADNEKNKFESIHDDNGIHESNELYYVEFKDGFFQLKNNYAYEYENIGSNLKQVTIDISQFEQLKEITLSETEVTLVAQPIPQLIKMNEDIPIAVSDVIDINSFMLTLYQNNGGRTRWLASCDSGSTWYGLNAPDGSWVNVGDLSNNNFIKNNTTLRFEFGNTIYEFHELRNMTGHDPNKIRFAFFLYDGDYTDKTKIDTVTMELAIGGTFVPYLYTGSGVTNPISEMNPIGTLSYDDETGWVTIQHPDEDVYMINYLDIL